MWVLLVVGVFLLFLCLVFYLLNFFLSVKDLSYCKVSTFESGFSSVGLIQSSFSIHFFVMMLMFVIFDLEVVMLLGVLVSDVSSFISFLLFMFFVFGGFYMEWWYGKLVWML
uniref:NADH-ubiquinone oxidoreductase chain 3 n=1 Tax=Ascaridia galli TaxID=46685 RepID=S4UE75_9BILA|nr:NADH dehydrogenase subunit 3 [Ascaridia galli]AGI96015.1 NADH dehydrogenase subunit 3 [Ascaridia galli]WEB60578.1 NADH dehydrogenase subunit 3 [Ascaridia galli]